MPNIHIFAFAALTAFPSVAPISAYQQEKTEGTWEAEFRTSRVHLNLRMDRTRGYSNYGRSFPVSELTALQRSGRNVSFELRRPAGVFRFEGTGSEQRAAGRYEFNPNIAFRRALEATGLRDLPTQRMLVLAINGVSLDDVRYLQRTVKGGFDSAELVRMLDHGVNPEFVREIHAAGFATLTSSELTRTRDHGVDGDFIRDMRAVDVRLTLDGYINARDHGVTPEYVGELREQGFKNTFDQMLRARDHGVDARFISGLSAAGLSGLTLSHYVALRDHGVDADYARDFSDLGYQQLEPDELIRLRDHGVTPGYARRANRDAGKRLEPEELVRRRSRGID